MLKKYTSWMNEWMDEWMNVVPEKFVKCKCENVKFLEIDSVQIRYQSEYIALAQWIYFLHKWSDCRVSGKISWRRGWLRWILKGKKEWDGRKDGPRRGNLAWERCVEYETVWHSQGIARSLGWCSWERGQKWDWRGDEGQIVNSLSATSWATWSHWKVF